MKNKHNQRLGSDVDRSDVRIDLTGKQNSPVS
jgi:hypothetical protein